MSEQKSGFYGKYRGVVVTNVDPMQMGRIQAQVPDVLGINVTSWAMPCVPFAGIQSGLYCVPAVGAGVWIEFEQGDPEYPVWTGGWWATAAEVPSLALMAPPGLPSIVLQTSGQNAVVISDVPGPTGGIVLRSLTGATIIVNDSGIFIQNGKGASIVLAGPIVDINNGALTII
jgi:uncharacterized protein involved in type VI secretion and phage assembly